MKFLKSNPNPKGHSVGDCAVRACVYATGKTWDKVYQELCAVGFELKSMPNDRKTIERYLNRHGFVKHSMPRRADRTRYTVAEFVDELIPLIKPPEKTVVLSLAGHVATIVDGELLDTSNCGYKSVGNYYKKYN